MLSRLQNVRRTVTLGVVGLLLAPYYLMSSVYWWMVRSVAKTWGRLGLHAISVGNLVAGGWKTRSFYREDMLLGTMRLLVDLRGKSCLDLGCADGYWSFRLGYAGVNKCTGVDRDPENIRRANFLKTAYNFPNFDFKCRDIFRFLYDDNEDTYDIILLLSILYHLPSESDWHKFFSTLFQTNEYCVIIDSRWFDDDPYWYDRTSGQAIIRDSARHVEKWRPTRDEVFSYLRQNGYERVLEVNPSGFLQDQEEAYGNGDPYTLQNVSDYITGHRTIVVAYKWEAMMPDVKTRMSVKYACPTLT